MNKGIRTVVYPVKDIGGGGLITSVKDDTSNIIALIQQP
jgi:predicted enzyme related to lactoylglutathione lyase